MNNRISNFHSKLVEVNLVVDTAIYGDGDLLSDRVAAAIMDRVPRGIGKIRGEVVAITLLDKDDEGALLDLVFLDADVTLGTINGAPTISDLNSERVLAVVPVTSYTDLGGARVATPAIPTATGTIPFEIDQPNLYVAAVSRSTPTYTAASDLRLKLFVRLHNVDL